MTAHVVDMDLGCSWSDLQISFCLCTEPITVVLILNGHCQTISPKDFKRIICCLIGVQCITHAQGVFLFVAMFSLPWHIYLCPSPLSALPAEPCLLLLWHQASCQATPASHQDPGMVSKLLHANFGWATESRTWDRAGTRPQLLAAAGASPSQALCSHSHHSDLTLPPHHPHRVQQLQPYHGSGVSQLRSEGIWRRSAKWQHFSLLP